jgi:glyoxylase I family protein
MIFKRIDHVEIVPINLEKTLDFYLNVLGCQLKSRMKMDRGGMKEIVFVTLGDTMIEFIDVKEAAPASTAPYQNGYRAIALEVEDMDKAVEYLKTKGVTLPNPPMVMGKTKRGEIRDPDGFPIELRQW